MTDKNKNHKKSTKKTLFKLIAAVLLAVIAAGAFILFTQVFPQLNRARQLKAELKTMASQFADMDVTGAEETFRTARQTANELQDSFSRPFWQFASGFSFARTEFDAAYRLLALWDTASAELIEPAFAQLRDRPLSVLTSDDGGRLDTAVSYLDLAYDLLPKAARIMDGADELDLGLLDRSGRMTQLLSLACTAVDVAGEYRETLLAPVVEQLHAFPLSELKKDDGFNVTLINSYLSFAESILPVTDQAVLDLKNADYKKLTDSETVQKLFNKYDELRKLYDDNLDLIGLARTFLGSGEDRLYLIVAQNSAETRASGGFPGSVGTVSIRGGILKIGTFKSVYSMLPGHVPLHLMATADEKYLFRSDTTNMSCVWDANLCPDFERVAEIWCGCYENVNSVRVDGIVSLTPAVIQEILRYAGEITLSDGTVLDGENTARILQHDLYFRYFTADCDLDEANAQSDKLFAETAKLAVSKAMENLSVEKVTGYAAAARKGFADRTIMLWMQDSSEQRLVHDMGISGGLNNNKNKPVTGFYFNVTVPSKLGWFIDLDTQIGEPTKNEDQSLTYPVTVTLTNVLSKAEQAAASRKYILGDRNGYIEMNAYIFAPKRGTVSNFYVSEEDAVVVPNEYAGLQMGVLYAFKLEQDTPLVISYQVTTAPGVDTPLRLEHTPTLQDYR